MNLMILHLSDIHIKANNDPVLSRGEKIVDAAKNLYPEVDLALVIVTGDIAFSGGEDQYSLAQMFLGTVCNGLRTHLTLGAIPSPPVHLILIPGNHDCRHPDESVPGVASARDIIIEKAKMDAALARESSIVKLCTDVQLSFFNLLDAVSASGLQETAGAYDGRLQYEYRFRVGQESVAVLCCNTAWLSRKDEVQGGLLFPPDAVPERPPDADIVLSLLHHPYNWLEHNSARVLRKRLEAYTDILMTGHEHDATFRQQESGHGERNIYVEGGVLQESNSLSSSFNVILVNTKVQQQAFISFAWQDGSYVPQSSDFNPLTNELQWCPYQMGALRRAGTFDLAKKWSDHLKDLGVNLHHNRYGRLMLSDVYVHPDLREAGYLGRRPEKDELPLARVVRGQDVPDLMERLKHIVVTGDDQSGKTSFAKTLFLQMKDRGYVPVFLTGRSTMPGQQGIGHYVEKKFVEQYDSASLLAFKQLDRSRRAIIFDDYHLVRMRPKEKRNLIEQLSKFAGQLIIVSDDHALKTEDLLDSAAEALFAFARFDIMPFGHVKQEELIDKWLSLDPEAENETVEFARRVVRLHDTFTAIVGKNFVPAFPIYLLAILQSDAAVDIRASTHGYFYELFIRGALAKGRTRFEFDVVEGYLSDLAHHMFKVRITEIDSAALEAFHTEYEGRYDIRRPFSQMVGQLVEQHILAVRDGIYSFKYDYLYYYFTAKFIGSHIQDQEAREHVAAMSRSLYVKEFANIMLFLAHISKDPIIIGEMLNAAEALYKGQGAANMESDVEFLNYPGHEIEPPAYQDKRPSEARRELNEVLDRQTETESKEGLSQLEPAPIAAPQKELDDILASDAASKTLQILGQIVKNFPGTIEKDDKFKITRACYLLGLRCLSWTLDQIRQHEKTLTLAFSEVFRSGDLSLNAEACQQRARNLIFHLGWILSFSYITRISTSVGSPDLAGTYEKILADVNCTATELINIALKLEQTGKPPIGKLRELGKTLKGNQVALWVLRLLAIRYLYMFGGEYTTKQAVCQAVDVRFERLHLADRVAQRLVNEGGSSAS